MIDIQSINLANLRNEYFIDKAPQRAIAILKKGDKERKLKTLLRDHRKDDVDDQQEISKRDDVDELLSYYSILEIGAIAGFVPPQPTREDSEDAEWVLNNKHVRRFYEEFYPLRLPVLHRYRLAGEWGHTEESARAGELFVGFLQANAVIANDDDVNSFLALLDDFTDGEFCEEKLVEALDDLPAMIKRLAASDSDQDALSSALAGMMKFFQFCPTLLRVLDSASEMPILRAAMWHYHSYWFTELQDGLGNSLRRFQRGALKAAKTAEDDEVDEVEQLKAHLQELVACLDQLCDKKIGKPIKSAIAALSDE